jgi:hypothetical protein
MLQLYTHKRVGCIPPFLMLKSYMYSNLKFYILIIHMFRMLNPYSPNVETLSPYYPIYNPILPGSRPIMYYPMDTSLN